jgi:hypothetical protein
MLCGHSNASRSLLTAGGGGGGCGPAAPEGGDGCGPAAPGALIGVYIADQQPEPLLHEALYHLQTKTS